MHTVTVRFYEELNDFLPKQYRKKDRRCSFNGKRSVKDFIESLGVPHVEVDLILVNGESVDFNYILNDDDRISVYPVFERLNIENATRLRPVPLRETRFVLDVHLRKLARRLRLLGFDVDYEDNRDDDELAIISHDETRVLLTRDRGLLKRSIVTRGLIVRNTDPEGQVIEVLDRLDLWTGCRPFTRCIECNGVISKLSRGDEHYEEAMKYVPEGVLSWCREFFYCSACRRVYWRGSHYEKLVNIVDGILNNRNASV